MRAVRGVRKRQRTHTNAGTQARLHNASKYYPFSVRPKRTYKTRDKNKKANLKNKKTNLKTPKTKGKSKAKPKSNKKK